MEAVREVEAIVGGDEAGYPLDRALLRIRQSSGLRFGYSSAAVSRPDYSMASRRALAFLRRSRCTPASAVLRERRRTVVSSWSFGSTGARRGPPGGQCLPLFCRPPGLLLLAPCGPTPRIQGSTPAPVRSRGPIGGWGRYPKQVENANRGVGAGGQGGPRSAQCCTDAICRRRCLQCVTRRREAARSRSFRLRPMTASSSTSCSSIGPGSAAVHCAAAIANMDRKGSGQRKEVTGRGGVRL